LHSKQDLLQIRDDVVACRRCPRLVEYREQVARSKKREFADWDYWGRPVPGFGDPDASLLIVGLAPAAHGGNRTGRVFTGDRSGDFLVKMLYEAGFANQPLSESRNDGLKLDGVYITAAVKCAPPDNKPTGSETSNCSEYLAREMKSLSSLTAVLCLGQFAFNAVARTLRAKHDLGPSHPRFKHGRVWSLAEPGLLIFCSYHPSPRNTQTGKLTGTMFLTLLRRIRRKIETRSTNIHSIAKPSPQTA
jgi:uracil-DNA glycosylase family 4